MAGLGRKDFQAGAVLSAADVDGYLMDQTVMKFANTAAAGSAYGTAISEGMNFYLSDTDEVVFYTGSAFSKQGSSDVAGKNKIINGGFDFWQRGASFSSTGYTADRMYFSVGGTCSAARESSIVPSGSTYSLKVTTGASSSFGEVYYALEGSDVTLLAGQTITVTVQVRAQASFAGNAVIAIQTNTTADTQTGGTWTPVTDVQIAPSTSGFTRMTSTYAVPAGTKGLRVRMAMASAQASGTGLYWGQLQLEAGSVATPFSRAGGTLQGELAACQRYYQRFGDTVNEIIGTGAAGSLTTALITIVHKVTMRTAPTIGAGGASNLKISPGSGSQYAVSSLSLAVDGRQGSLISVNCATGLVANAAVNMFGVGGGGYVDLSAEL